MALSCRWKPQFPEFFSPGGGWRLGSAVAPKRGSGKRADKFMVKVRAAGPDDKIEIERLTEMALGISAAGKGEEVPGAGRRIWLAWAGEGEGAASPAGFCRIVPDRESSARGWLCLDAIFVSPDDRRKGLGRALIEETKGASRSGGLVGVSAFLPANFPESFVKNTGGAKVRSLLLLRAENLETRPPSPPGWLPRPRRFFARGPGNPGRSL